MRASQIVSGISFGILVAAVAPVSAGDVKLSGANEAPPVSTQASGVADIKVNSDGTVSGNVSVSGMTPTAAHIHHGAAGKDGPITIGLVKTSGTAFKVPDGAKFTEAQYKEYKAGNMYVNVHSAKHKGGEVRGQLEP